MPFYAFFGKIKNIKVKNSLSISLKENRVLNSSLNKEVNSINEMKQYEKGKVEGFSYRLGEVFFAMDIPTSSRQKYVQDVFGVNYRTAKRWLGEDKPPTDWGVLFQVCDHFSSHLSIKDNQLVGWVVAGDSVPNPLKRTNQKGISNIINIDSPSGRFNFILDDIHFSKVNRANELFKITSTSEDFVLHRISEDDIRSWLVDDVVPSMKNINALIDDLCKTYLFTNGITTLKSWWKIGGDLNDNKGS